jgi:hypothetical protein
MTDNQFGPEQFMAHDTTHMHAYNVEGTRMGSRKNVSLPAQSLVVGDNQPSSSAPAPSHARTHPPEQHKDKTETIFYKSVVTLSVTNRSYM